MCCYLGESLNQLVGTQQLRCLSLDLATSKMHSLPIERNSRCPAVHARAPAARLTLLHKRRSRTFHERSTPQVLLRVWQLVLVSVCLHQTEWLELEAPVRHCASKIWDTVNMDLLSPPLHLLHRIVHLQLSVVQYMICVPNALPSSAPQPWLKLLAIVWGLPSYSCQRAFNHDECLHVTSYAGTSARAVAAATAAADAILLTLRHAA